jgi:hypothetical protein
MDILTALIPMLREPRIGPFTREAILVSFQKSYFSLYFLIDFPILK